MAWIKNEDESISNLKVGDSCWQIERNHQFPDGIAKWKAKVIRVEDNFIETEYFRDVYCVWLQELVQKLIKEHKLLTNHRTFNKTNEKNFYAPDGSINIKAIK